MKQPVVLVGGCVCKHWNWVDGWLPCTKCIQEAEALKRAEPTKEELRDERTNQS